MSEQDLEFRSESTVELIDYMGSDDSILRAMLVSTGRDDDLGSMSSKLGRINFLMSNRHGSPFEHNAMTFRIEAPIFVFREYQRHRIGFSYNEFSGRYAELPPVFYVPNISRALVQVGKPGDYKYIAGSNEQWRKLDSEQRMAAMYAWRLYQEALKDGVSKEVARMVLPVSIFSYMYVTCNARSMMSFLSLRVKADHFKATYPSTPMWEINEVANKMERKFESLFPITHGAFVKNGRVAP